MEQQLAIAGAALAGQMTLAGLILVYQGFAVSWWRSQTGSEGEIAISRNEFEWFLRTTTIAVVTALVGTIAPILALTLENPSAAWTVPAVLMLSILLVIGVAIEGYKLFRLPKTTVAK